MLPHQTRTTRSSPFATLEVADVLNQLLGEIPLVLALLDVRAVEPLHVVTVEHGRHRLDGRQLVLDLIEERPFQDAGRLRGLVAVVLEDVPAAKHEIVETRPAARSP